MTPMKRKRLVKRLQKLRKATINQVIDSLYQDDINEFNKSEMIEIGWRYYVHLNKHFAPMERDGLIEQTGEEVMGEFGKMEKLWRSV